MPEALNDSPAALDRFGYVTDAGRERLIGYVELLRTWQKTHNLVAPSTLGAIWTRHVADSLQLIPLAPRSGEWVDLGSGGGFPGLAIAVALGDQSDVSFTLVESNSKKVAFLRAAIRQSGARAMVVAGRIDAYGQSAAVRADVVSARALASTAELCRLAYPLLRPSGVMVLLKGQDFVHEEREAAKSWSYDLLDSPSLTDPGGHVVRITQLQPRRPP